MRDFVFEDLEVVGGVISEFKSISSDLYSAKFTPSANGICSIKVDTATFLDAAGNVNRTIRKFDWTYDGTPPIIAISAANGDKDLFEGDSTKETLLTFTFTSSEETINFDLEDIETEGGGFTNFSKIDRMTSLGIFLSYGSNDKKSILIGKNTYEDVPGNSNAEQTEFNWIYDSNKEPQLLDNTVLLPENTPNGNLVTTIIASDPDNDVLFYRHFLKADRKLRIHDSIQFAFKFLFKCV